MLKEIVILLNVGIIVFLVVVSIREGFPHLEEPFDLFLYLWMYGMPIVNVVALIKGGGEDWFSLFFRRKAMEEKKRISELEEKTKE